jgi:rod shape-determining protein MreD
MLWKGILFFLVILAIQGPLRYLLPPGFGPPDLFLLASLVLAARVKPVWGLLAAYGLGLVQDLVGHGLLGLHAIGLAGAVLLYYGLQRWLGRHTLLQETLGLLAALLGQWGSYLIVAAWLRDGLITPHTLVTIFPLEVLATLIFFPLVQAFARWAFGELAVPEAQQP